MPASTSSAPSIATTRSATSRPGGPSPPHAWANQGLPPCPPRRQPFSFLKPGHVMPLKTVTRAREPSDHLRHLIRLLQRPLDVRNALMGRNAVSGLAILLCTLVIGAALLHEKCRLGN